MPIELSQATTTKIDDLLTHYPVKQGALLPILHAVQDELGHLTLESLEWIAEKVQVPPATVYGVATFYPMYRMAPVGRYVLGVCATIPCAICGSRELVAALKAKLGIDVGQTTPDGKFTLKKVECLAACHEAPVVLVNKKLYRNVQPEKVDEFLASLP